jgi:hypothetical protein
MKRIGRGWLYAVYDLGNGRVRKIVYSDLVRFFVIFFQLGHFSISDTISEMKRVKRDAYQAYSYLRKIKVIDSKILGNPVFIDELSYEQDKVSVVGDLLKDKDLNEGERIIGQYVRFIHETWRHGFADKIFNFTINNGVDGEGNIIQIDFGELSLSRSDVEREVSDSSWLTSFSYITLSPFELKKHYQELMKKELTLENLNSNWKGN